MFCAVKLGWDEIYGELKSDLQNSLERINEAVPLPPCFMTNSEQFMEFYRPGSIYC